MPAAGRQRFKVQARVPTGNQLLAHTENAFTVFSVANLKPSAPRQLGVSIDRLCHGASGIIMLLVANAVMSH
jgi:hypothetical protein